MEDFLCSMRKYVLCELPKKNRIFSKTLFNTEKILEKKDEDNDDRERDESTSSISHYHWRMRKNASDAKGKVSLKCSVAFGE